MRNFSAKEKDLCSGNLRYFRETSSLLTVFTELKFCNKNENARNRKRGGNQTRGELYNKPDRKQRLSSNSSSNRMQAMVDREKSAMT